MRERKENKYFIFDLPVKSGILSVYLIYSPEIPQRNIRQALHCSVGAMKAGLPQYQRISEKTPCEIILVPYFPVLKPDPLDSIPPCILRFIPELKLCNTLFFPLAQPQSELGSTFEAVRKDLQEGKQVLFSGTACQCSGLKAYLSGHASMGRLFRTDRNEYIFLHQLSEPEIPVRPFPL